MAIYSWILAAQPPPRRNNMYLERRISEFKSMIIRDRSFMKMMRYYSIRNKNRVYRMDVTEEAIYRLGESRIIDPWIRRCVLEECRREADSPIKFGKRRIVIRTRGYRTCIKSQ